MRPALLSHLLALRSEFALPVRSDPLAHKIRSHRGQKSGSLTVCRPRLRRLPWRRRLRAMPARADPRAAGGSCAGPRGCCRVLLAAACRRLRLACTHVRGRRTRQANMVPVRAYPRPAARAPRCLRAGNVRRRRRRIARLGSARDQLAAPPLGRCAAASLARHRGPTAGGAPHACGKLALLEPGSVHARPARLCQDRLGP